ncbi:MAG: heparan-alpha-glucosaminide N-acetyltransferase domain-containing protein [Ginsengibacter sp.]
MKRITSIDFTRGIVMIIMALDHTRDLMQVNSLTQSPTDLTTTTPILFFTRWITHFCAPTFVFLAGLSAFLSFKNKNDVAASRKFLLTRGVWLIILEFTLVNFGMFFDIHFNSFIFEVIAAIGLGFIILSLLLKVTVKTIGMIGLCIIFGHNLFSLIPFAEGSLVKTILSPFFVPGAFPITSKIIFVIAYPPIPWLGIILVGFAAGKIFQLDPKRRKQIFFKISLTALALFVIIRFINIYGDSSPWSVQKNGLYTFLSFINVTKYPPSLLFCLLMLGGMFLILSLAENLKIKLNNFVIVYGKVPLFYFLIHFYLIHLLMLVMVYLQGFKASDLIFGFNFGRPKTGSGVSLFMIYLIWISVVIVLYPVCKWYGKYKMVHQEKKWLRYF